MEKHFIAVALIQSETGWMDDSTNHLLTAITTDNIDEMLSFFEHIVLGSKYKVLQCSVKVLTDGKEDKDLTSQMGVLLHKVVDSWNDSWSQMIGV